MITRRQERRFDDYADDAATLLIFSPLPLYAAAATRYFDTSRAFAAMLFSFFSLRAAIRCAMIISAPFRGDIFAQLAAAMMPLRCHYFSIHTLRQLFAADDAT